MPSFDIESEIDQHELTNAVDQANREIDTRFDFKGSNAKFELKDDSVLMSSPNDFQLQQMLDILTNKMTKRGLDVRCIDAQEPEVNLSEARQTIQIKQGIDQALGKKINKMIKESKLKVQSAIQGDKVRITGKKRDDLQEAIALLKEAKLEMPLQYTNFRD